MLKEMQHGLTGFYRDLTNSLNSSLLVGLGLTVSGSSRQPVQKGLGFE